MRKTAVANEMRVVRKQDFIFKYRKIVLLSFRPDNRKYLFRRLIGIYQ
jgi:hypothetical protein